MRKTPLVNGQYYHIFSRSIAKYRVFNSDEDYQRIVDIVRLYQFLEFKDRFSEFDVLSQKRKDFIYNDLKESGKQMVEIVAYCIMPTHLHFILKQVEDSGISKFVSRSLNSFSKYFNNKHKRKGPLWEARFNSVLVEKDEQLLHLTRYIHLNPCSAGLVENPKEWKFSSYSEYVRKSEVDSGICKYHELIPISPKEYKVFVTDHISFQRELSRIKHLLIDNYSG